MTQRYRKAAALLGAVAALTVAAVPVAQAKHGADDPPNHHQRHHHHHHHGEAERGDDHGRR
jgi:Spy/CpxP family protein refolding chaperone